MKPYFLRFICRNFPRCERKAEEKGGSEGAPGSAEPPASTDPSLSHLPPGGAYPGFSGSLEPSRAPGLRETALSLPYLPYLKHHLQSFPKEGEAHSSGGQREGAAAVPAAHAVQVPELDRCQEEQQR